MKSAKSRLQVLRSIHKKLTVLLYLITNTALVTETKNNTNTLKKKKNEILRFKPNKTCIGSVC